MPRAEAQDPEISRLRGRTPLVLVPIANPANAEAMIDVASALTPPRIGRVLLLSVAVLPEDWKEGDHVPAVRHAQTVLGDTLLASAGSGLFPEALATVAANPWEEIGRIATEHRCECLLLGLTNFAGEANESHLNEILATAGCEVLVLRSPPGWRLADVREILVPVGGLGWHDRLRARLLGSLFRTGDRQVTFLRVVPEGASEQTIGRVRRAVARIARDEAPGRSRVQVVAGRDAARTIIERAAESQLVVLGVEPHPRPPRRLRPDDPPPGAGIRIADPHHQPSGKLSPPSSRDCPPAADSTTAAGPEMGLVQWIDQADLASKGNLPTIYDYKIMACKENPL